MHDMAFALRLKSIRKQCGLTQQTIAQILGIDRSTYAYYETGKTHPDLEALCRLAGIFCLTTDELLGMTPLSSSLHDEALSFEALIAERFSSLSQEEQLLLLQYRQLTAEQRELLSKTLRTLTLGE